MKPTLPSCPSGQITTRLVLFTLLLLGLGQTRGFAQNIFQYTNLTSGVGTVAPNATATALTRGAPSILQATDCMPDQGFGSHGWPTTNTFNVTNFNTNGWYVTVKIKPLAGYGLKITGFSARSRRENPTGTAHDGPLAIRYGYAKDDSMSFWKTVNPGNPQSSNVCASGGVLRVWPSTAFPITVNDSITFRVYGLSSGSAFDGDLFLRDLIVEGVVCADEPAIALDFENSDLEVCQGETLATLAYSSTDASTYSIDYDAAANLAGFADQGIAAPHLNFTGSPIPLTVPAMAAADTYYATLTIYNACGFSTSYEEIAITVNPLPDVSATLSAAEICEHGSVTLTLDDLSDSGNTFHITANLVDDNGTNPIDIPGIPDPTVFVLIEGVHFFRAGGGTVSVTDIVVIDETTLCQTTLPNLTLTVNPLPIPSIAVAETSGIGNNDAAICAGASVTLTASGGATYAWSTGATTAAITVNPVITTTYTVTATSADACTSSASQSVTVNPYPVATFLPTPTGPVCPGSTVEIDFDEAAYDAAPTTTFDLFLRIGPGSTDTLNFNHVGDTLQIHLTEGTDFDGDLLISEIMVTESVSGCASLADDVPVDVLPEPELIVVLQNEYDQFSPPLHNEALDSLATTGYEANDSLFVNLENMDFLVGNHLTFSGYADNGNVGYTTSYTSSGNVTYDGGSIPAVSGPSNIAPSNAASFFGTVYGGALGYGLLNPGDTSGTINQIFVPYLDNDDSDDFTAGDCEGVPVFLNYRIYAVPTVTIDPPSVAVCNNTPVNFNFSGNYGSGASYHWTNSNTAIGLAASGTGDISFLAAGPHTTDANFTIVVTPSAHGFDGIPVSFSNIVHPEPLVNNITLTVNGGSPQSVNNTNGPSTVILDMCAGQTFQYSLYQATAGIGFVEEIVDGTTNLLYGNSVIPVPRPATNISAVGAPYFFSSSYGPYNLAPGETYGWMLETFTPYYDADEDGFYDPMTDCLSEHPITVIYQIHAAPTGTADPLESTICSGDYTDIALSSDINDATFSWEIDENPGEVEGAEAGSGNTIHQQLTGSGTVVYLVTPTGPAPTECVGEPFTVSVTVNPVVDASITVNDNLICEGSSVTFTFHEYNYPDTTEFTVTADVSPNVYGNNTVLFEHVRDGDDVTLTEGAMADFQGSLTVSNIHVTVEGIPACEADVQGSIVITVNPQFTASIEGPTCVHAGAAMQLTGNTTIELPATLETESWSPAIMDNATVDANGLVTGNTVGETTIYYTATDNAGCSASASYMVQVLGPLTFTLSAEESPVGCGGLVKVKVAVTNFCDISGLVFSAHWDSTKFEYVTNPGWVSPLVDAEIVLPPNPIGSLDFQWAGSPAGLQNGDLVFCYYLKALGSSGSDMVSLSNILASNSYSPTIPVAPVTPLPLVIQPLSLVLAPHPSICSNQDTTTLHFCGVVGNPNHYEIDFDAAAEMAGFPLSDGGTLVTALGCGTIVIDISGVPHPIAHGTYHATLIISNTETGCQSIAYPITIVVDDQPPTATLTPTLVEVDCIGEVPAPNTSIVTPMDNCPGNLTVMYVGFTDNTQLPMNPGTGCCGHPIVITRTYKVTDAAGNTTTVTQTIEVEDCEAPVIQNAPVEGFHLLPCYASEQAIRDYITANLYAGHFLTDNCSTPSVMGVTIVQQGATCTYDVTIAVTDQCNNLSAMANHYTTVIDDTAPVVVAGEIAPCYEILQDNDPQTQDAVQAAIEATMADSYDACSQVTYTAQATGPDAHCIWSIVVTVSDACGHTASVTYTTRVDNTPPIIQTPVVFSTPFLNTWTSNALVDHCYPNEEEAGAAASALVTAIDGCSEPTKIVSTWDVVYADDSDCPDTKVVVAVTDECGNATFVEFPGIRVDDIAPVIPVPETPADTLYIPDISCFQTQEEAENYMADFVLGIVEDCTPTEDLDIEAVYTLVEQLECEYGEVTVTVTDCAGNISQETYPVNLDDTDPVFSELPTIEVVCLDDIPLAEDLFTDIQNDYVYDACSDVTVTVLEDVLPSGCGNSLDVQGHRTYLVTDCAGNTATQTQILLLNDTEPPQWEDGITSSTLGCECQDASCIAIKLAFKPVVTDNGCASIVPILLDSTDVTVGCSRTITRTWTAKDDCDNEVAEHFVQTVIIQDLLPPTFLETCQFMNLNLYTSEGYDCPQTATISLEAGDELGIYDTWTVAGFTVPALGPDCVDDNCSADEDIVATVVSIESETGEDCSLTITLELELRDACGNVQTEHFFCVYNIIDDVAPTWTTGANALNFNLECSDAAGLAIVQALAPVAQDACDMDVQVVKTSGDFVAGSCPQAGTYTNTWIATDCSGNYSTTFTQVITIQDTKAPTWTTPAGNLNRTVSCSDGTALMNAQALVPAAQDCDLSPTIVKSTGLFAPNNNCPSTGTYTNTWTATDHCGHTSVLYMQVITVVDTTRPTILMGGGIAACYHTAADAQAAAIAATSAMDNCSPATKTATVSGDCAAVVTVVVSDCSGNTATKTFNTRIDNTGPTLTEGTILHCYPDIPTAEAAAKAATVRTDNCPGGMSISASTSGLCPATITVTVTDGCGNSSSVVYGDNNFNICIGPSTALTIVTPAHNDSSNCESAVNALNAWILNHGGAVASDMSATWTNTPVVYGPVDCMTHSKTATVTFTATNACGYTAQTTATFKVKDNVPPTANAISNTNLTCGTNIPGPNVNSVVNAMDNCGTPTVALYASSDNMAPGCPGQPRIIIYQYSVTDSFCNFILVNHTITVIDNIPPTFTKPADISVNGCTSSVSTTASGDVTNESDNCSTGLNATYTDVVTAGVGFQNKFKINRTWTLTDNCGNSASAQVQMITVKDVTPPTISGCPANTTIPGQIDVVEGLTVCRGHGGTSPQPAFSDNCGVWTSTYALSGATIGSGNGYLPNGQIYNEGVTTVTYTVTDAVGNTATCSYTVTVNCLTISGRIIWEHDDVSGVKDATVKLSQGVTQLGSDLSDTLGRYDLPVPAAGMFTVTPVKNINRLNGVTAADATRILNHVSNANPITDPYRKVCADVNHNGTISNLDANIITGAIAGQGPSLAAFNVFWRFTPTTYVMPATTLLVVPAFPEFKNVTVGALDVTGVDFFGMKIGDVDSVWANPLMLPNLAPLVWVLQNQTLVAGTEIELGFAASNFNNLAAYQMALDFDPTQLQFMGFQTLGALPMTVSDNFGVTNANLGELRNVWSVANGTTLTDGTQVFRAKFKVLASGQKLSEVLKLDPSQIECKAYNQALVPTDVKLVFAESVGTDAPLDPSHLSLQLMQNRPNPFSDATTIGFILPEACEAHIRILDISGRELTTYDRNYTAGYHELDFRMENAVSYGVLFCELVTPQGKRVIKMVTTK